MRCKLAQTLAFARSMIFNTKNAIVLSLEQARMEYEISHAYLGKKGRLWTHQDATKTRFIEYRYRG
jgi:hypothetical protein